jgi:1-acyl-sn-glycerol-3-phosphate acyltransferase
VVTAVLGIPATLLGLCGMSTRRSRAMAGTWGRLLLRLGGIRVEVRQLAALPQGPAVYASNHVSALDIPILFAHLPADFRILHKRSLYLAPVVGQYLYVAGHIGINRSNAFKARRDLQRAAARIRSGTSVAVFPEGTRNPDGRVTHFKRGSFGLAIDAGVPVVPVSLSGVSGLAGRGVLFLKPGTVVLTIHPPVPTAGLPPEAARDLAEQVQHTVASATEAHP